MCQCVCSKVRTFITPLHIFLFESSIVGTPSGGPLPWTFCLQYCAADLKPGWTCTIPGAGTRRGNSKCDLWCPACRIFCFLPTLFSKMCVPRGSLSGRGSAEWPLVNMCLQKVVFQPTSEIYHFISIEWLGRPLCRAKPMLFANAVGANCRYQLGSVSAKFDCRKY